jgi:LCP family protein required for cell wall assembly
LILGLDEGFNRSSSGYTDTIILTSISSINSKLVLLSIPRDLWVQTPEKEGIRIGSVYKIVEANKSGNGPTTIAAIVNKSFQVPVHYHVLVRMQGFMNIIDALGGVDITLVQPMAKYPIGNVHLDGQAALAFVRDRDEIDDFARMHQAHILIERIIIKAFKFQVWGKLPHALYTLKKSMESNIPLWIWLQLSLMVLYARLNGIESHTITRDMVTPKITPEGEQVLEPDWDRIRAFTHMIFEKHPLKERIRST